MMRKYDFISLGDIYHEVVLRVGLHRNAHNISDDTIIMYINRAAREIMSLTVPYKEWGYKSSMWVENNTVLPSTYLGFIRVLCSDNGDIPYNEARYVDPKEWFTLTNWQRAQAWNRGSYIRPVFTIHGFNIDDTSVDTRMAIYLFPNTDNLGVGPPPEGYDYPTTNMKGWLEYYRAPDYATQMDDIILIPYSYEDILVNYTLSRIYAKLTDIEKLNDVMSEIGKWKVNIKKQQEEKREKEKRELESFVEPEPPFVTAPPTEGELPKDLVSGVSPQQTQV